MSTVKGSDLSHYQSAIQFHDIVDAGVQFVILKATQGIAGIDPDFVDFRQRAHSVGLVVGAYHFFDPSADPMQQARHFVNVARPVPGELIMTLDTETDAPNIASASMAFALEVKQLTGKLPMIYSSDSLYGGKLANTFPFPAWAIWLARYGAEPKHKAHFWQYSETGRIGSVTVDTDVFYGTLDELKAGFCYPSG